MPKKVTDKPTGSTVIWNIQKRLRERGFDISTDGDIGPKTFWDNSETLRAVLEALGGPVQLPAPPAPTPSLTGKRVYIDVGHGPKPEGFDPGAVHAPSGPTEHDLNMVGATALAIRLRERGITATVADGKLSNYDAGTAAKGSDIFVSFHHNAAAGRAQYSLACYDGRRKVSEDAALAKLVSARTASALGIPDKGARDMALAVLSGTRAVGVPLAILVEPYFIHAQTPDNPDPAVMESWSKKAGAVIADAIADHIGV